MMPKLLRNSNYFFEHQRSALVTTLLFATFFPSFALGQEPSATAQKKHSASKTSPTVPNSESKTAKLTTTHPNPISPAFTPASQPPQPAAVTLRGGTLAIVAN